MYLHPPSRCASRSAGWLDSEDTIHQRPGQCQTHQSREDSGRYRPKTDPTSGSVERDSSQTNAARCSLILQLKEMDHLQQRDLKPRWKYPAVPSCNSGSHRQPKIEEAATIYIPVDCILYSIHLTFCWNAKKCTVVPTNMASVRIFDNRDSQPVSLHLSACSQCAGSSYVAAVLLFHFRPAGAFQIS